MSAIAGIFYLDDRPVERADLECMVATLAHRGPDGAGIWSAGPVGLGHRMLWTTPQSLKEKLPLANQSGDVVITADARIDNRDELIRALNFAGRPSEEITDSQLILAAYEKWGGRCLERLLGDFAFAIWDGRRGELFCARDAMGVKPFYYYRSGRVFVFASEIKGLLCLPEVPRRLNETRVADYLTGIFEDKVITFYEGISRLPPAHSLSADRKDLRIELYWSPNLSSEIRLSSDGEYVEAFREVFTEAVRCRLRSAYPVGSMLSGGLDSSSIVGIASRILAEDGDSRLSTFSAIFPSLADIDRRIDERPFIKAVLDTVGNLEPHYVHADRLSPLAFYDRFIWHTDEAVPAPNLYMDWAIFSAAQEQGTRVLLGGLDGDTTVSYGYDLLAELARTGRWMALIREATAFRARYYATTPLRKIIRHYALRPLVPQPIVDIWRTVRRRPQRVSVVDMPINPEFAQRIGLVKRARVLQDHPSGLTHTARKMHWMSLSSGLLLYALELLDKVAAACSLEARYPFFDRRLIEFCIGLPCTQKLHQGWTRAIHRSAVAGILPEEVRCRIRKGNLSANFKLRLLEDERDTLERIILKEMNTLENYIDTSALHTKYFRYASQPMEQEQDALAIFFAVTLAIWLNGSGFCA